MNKYITIVHNNKHYIDVVGKTRDGNVDLKANYQFFFNEYRLFVPFTSRYRM